MKLLSALSIKSLESKSNGMKILIILLFLILMNIPFLNRAIAVDEIYVAEMANHIIKKPLDPFGFEWYMVNRPLASAFTHSNPPLLSYYYAIIKFLFGESNIVLHAFFMIFSVVAAISMFYIAKRITKWPLFATLLLIFTPIYSVASHNFMYDIPVLALFLISVALFIEGLEENNKISLAISSIFAAIAFLTKYNAILIFPILALYAYLKRKPKYIAYFSISFILIFLWSIYEVHLYGAVHSVDFFFRWPATESLSSSVLKKASEFYLSYSIANISYLGGATIFFFFLSAPFVKTIRDLILLGVLIFINVVFAILLYMKSAEFLSGQYTIVQLILLIIFMTSSSYFLTKMVVPTIKSIANHFINQNRHKALFVHRIFLGLWFFLALFFHTVFAGGNARYLTVLLPPMVLYYCIMIEERIAIYKISMKKIEKVFFYCLFTTLVLGILLGIADYQYADTYRSFSNNIAYKYKSDRATYFTGHEGFKYYMEQNGYVFYDPLVHKLGNGDIIIKPYIPNPRNLDVLGKNLVLVDKIHHNSSFPIRLNNPWAHAGFYTFANGFLPFSISNSPLEIFEIYKFV